MFSRSRDWKYPKSFLKPWYSKPDIVKQGLVGPGNPQSRTRNSQSLELTSLKQNGSNCFDQSSQHKTVILERLSNTLKLAEMTTNKQKKNNERTKITSVNDCNSADHNVQYHRYANNIQLPLFMHANNIATGFLLHHPV